jgi:hypothetical protein
LKLEANPPAFRLIDKSFSADFSPGAHLSFIVSLSGFACCIFDLKKNRLTALEELFLPKQPNYETLCSKLRSFIGNSIAAGLKFKSVSAAVYNEAATLVPSALYEESGKKEFLRLNFTGDHGSVAADFIQDMELYNIYDLPQPVAETFKEIYGKVKLAHFSSSLLESLFIENKFKSGLKIYLHFFQKHPYGAVSAFEIIIFKNGNLLLFNSFPFQEKEDIAYYLLFAMEQLHINPEKATITLLGNIQKTDEMVELIGNYVRSVEFGGRPGNPEISPVFDELPPHFYYALLSQYLYI